ncbi:ATP-binding protein [Burkholderia anthina]|uniref:ATP-binding protein n=1 Tax=Burkholderia anthina TaxID=179879 RepID=UPI001AA08665|nr:ATP-binding protein [Burkholderia anthina]QTD89822.1 ATP-binding protein [Burkholderia anthina]
MNMIESGDGVIEIKQGVDPAYFYNILTKDVTTLECIFELIDNAVDAARDSLMRRKKAKLDKYGLPIDYSGFEVDINFGDDHVELIDNCAGIPEHVLKTRAFVVGAMSPHPFGIGRFGIGLKRALIGLGEKYRIDTDTGKFSARIAFGISAILDAKASLTGKRIESAGRARMFIKISKLRDRVVREINKNGWDIDISNHLSRRYGIFIDKGLVIRIDGVSVPQFGPKIRDIDAVKPQSVDVDLLDDVSVHIDAGMHQDYRLTGEQDYNKKSNAALTDQFGWYFVCNDRIVEVATHDKSLGWSSRWHQEYYGFVGWVKFIAKDPQDLPWDTKKSRIDPHAAVFNLISDRLQEFAEKYKKENKSIRVSPIKNQAEIESSKERVPGSNEGIKSSSSKGDLSPSPPEAHNENWLMLLPAMGVAVKDRKLSALVFEAERLELSHCYAAAMLLRAIVERSLLIHLQSRRKIGQILEGLRENSEERQGGNGIQANPMERPKLSDALKWLGTNEGYFPDEVRRDCVFARNKFALHLKKLNGVVHDGDLTNSESLRITRDDVMPLLEFLLAG